MCIIVSMGRGWWGVEPDINLTFRLFKISIRVKHETIVKIFTKGLNVNL